MSFNLLFDATVLAIVSDKRTRRGIYFVVANILKELQKNKELNVVLYYHPDVKDGEINTKSNIKDIFGQADIFPIVNSNIRIFEQCDIHAMLNLWCWSPEFLKGTNIKKYIFLYDCLPFLMPGYQYFLKKGEWFDRIISNLNKDDFYLTDSNHARKDFLKMCPVISEDKISTVYLAASEKFKNCSSVENKKYICEKYKIPGDYVFALCSLEPRKNIIMNIMAFIEFIKKHNITDLYYVLGGGKWDDFIKTIDAKIDGLNDYKKYIIRAGYVPDEDLPLMYSNAQWSVYTSLYEGFGLPALEAMSCGCPIVASNTTSLPEVVEEAGLLIDPHSMEEHIHAYEKYYYDKEFVKNVKVKSSLQVKKFSWKKTTDKILNIIKEQYKEDEYISVQEIKERIDDYIRNRDYGSTLTYSNSVNKKYYMLTFIPILRVKSSPEKKQYFIFNVIPLLKINKKKGKEKYKLFNFIPLLKISNKKEKRKYYIFNFIPLLKVNNKKGKMRYYIFNCVPFLKVKGNEEKRKYYLFGFLPLLKVKTSK